ncbi:Potassium/sodium hyperpolarization-activated cyclic nucleotide-gated channel 4 [Schistosoma japonicum]|nr:Potassium/sodium hyperpolarization-activated cyclic nucleotide-gated channel 4 [Schistosoma japonicum]
MSKARQHWRHRANPSFYMITDEEEEGSNRIQASNTGHGKSLSDLINLSQQSDDVEDENIATQGSEPNLSNSSEIIKSESRSDNDQSKTPKQIPHSHTTTKISNQNEGSESELLILPKHSLSSGQICSNSKKYNKNSSYNNSALTNTTQELLNFNSNNEYRNANKLVHDDSDNINYNTKQQTQSSQTRWNNGRHFLTHTPNKVHFNFSKSIDADDVNNTLIRGLFNRTFRPNLRRAVSEVKDVYNPDDTESSLTGQQIQQRQQHHPHRSQNKLHRHLQQQLHNIKAISYSALRSHQQSALQLHSHTATNQPCLQSYRINELTNTFEQIYNTPQHFDSSILEIPVDIFDEMTSEDAFPRINWASCDSSQIDSEHPLRSARLHELMTSESFKERDSFLNKNPVSTNETNTAVNSMPKRSNRLNAVRRMNTTAVEQHHLFGNNDRFNFKKQTKAQPSSSKTENYLYNNKKYSHATLSQDNINTSANKTLDSSSLEFGPDSTQQNTVRSATTALYRSSSSGTRNDIGYEKPFNIISSGGGISNSTTTLADKSTITQNANTSTIGVLQNSTTTTTATTTAITALANGNVSEPNVDPLKQSTSSYLKEQFQAFFQPSDNKLAMKLFGSKNALLKEKRRQVQQGKWVIHPCSNFRFYWDLLMLMLLIANLIILPVAISFFNDDLSIHWIIFNSISDVVFIADIAVKFRTGVVANDYADEIILNPKEIARHYLKSWFVLDFISSIPMDYLYLIFNKKDHYNQFFSAGRTLRILRLAKLLSMLRLLRLTRLVRYVSQWEEFLNIASKFMGIFNLVLLMLLLGHWNACLQYLIPMLMEFPPDSWVKRCKLENADWFQQYTWALFKAMSHMLSIGYGRFPPTSIGEAWITIVSMMSGATCYALFVGHAAALIQSFDTSKRLYREKFKQVEEYMAYRKLPRALRQRIANYYEHRYQGKMFDEAQILNEFSECLREQVINYNCRALVAAVPFFTYADQDFVSEVVTKLKFEVFQPGDLIIKEGTIGNKMYFIQEGIVDIITKDGEVATSLSDGSYFGEITLLTNARRVASVKAVVYSNLYSLDRESFLSVLENYPLMRRTMESVAAERLNKIGQNPSIVSNREDLKEDLSLVKEIVSSAVTPEDSSSGQETENDDNQAHLNIKQLLKFRKRKPSNRNKLLDNTITKLGQTNEEDDPTQDTDRKSSFIDITSVDKLKLPKFMRQKRNSSNIFTNPSHNLLNITKSKLLQSNSNENEIDHNKKSNSYTLQTMSNTCDNSLTNQQSSNLNVNSTTITITKCNVDENDNKIISSNTDINQRLSSCDLSNIDDCKQ